MKRICQLLFLIFASLLATMAFAIEGGSTPPTGSTQVSPPANPQVMIDCPQLTVSSQVVNQTSTPIRLGDVNDIVCTSGYYGGGVAIIGGVIGGQFEPFCPANMPYLGGYTENWGGSWAAAGGASMSAICCSLPQPQMSFVNTWENGPDCP